MSIKRSLRLSLLLMATLPLVFLIILWTTVANNNYLDASKEVTAANAASYCEGFTAQLDTQLVEANALANLNDIKTFLLKKYNNNVKLHEQPDLYEPIADTLHMTSTSFGGHVVYSLFDMDGTIVASSEKASIGTQYQEIAALASELTGSCVESQLSLTTGSAPKICILTPVVVKSITIGVLAVSIDQSYFGSFASDDTHTFIIDSSGYSLFPSQTGQEYPDIISSSLVRLRQYTGDSEELTGTILQKDTLTYSLFGYRLLPEYNWVYLVQQDNSLFSSLITVIPLLSIVVGILFFIVSAIWSSILTKKYTNPIYELKDNMEQACQNRLDVHCNIESNNEFGELSSMFNRMITIIHTNYTEAIHAKNKLEEKQYELEETNNTLEKIAYTDCLTGLANRAAFLRDATNLLHNHDGNIARHAIIFLDLDNFKNVNDTLGHDYGDLLLQQVSSKLSSFMGEGDIFARTGGDEFLVLRNKVESTTELDQFASTLVSIANHPFVLDDETVQISMSIGVALFPQNGLTVTELIKNADIAMYSAKTSGKNNYMFFNSSMEDEVNRKNEIADILRDAIANNELYLVYQPQTNIREGGVIGSEALMRLRSSYLGYISPAEFIPVAEECGLIDTLGNWALEEACRFNKSLIDQGFTPRTVSVNVSSVQLKGNKILPTIRRILSETQMPPEYLEIELTESVLMHSIDHNLYLMNEIKKMGVHIALDDFGTGYSSFNYLTSMPINTLKIDKSFIDGICVQEKDRYIAETIISLAHKMNIAVVAEGVEEQEQLDILQHSDCDIIQGYIFSKPLTDKEYIELLAGNSDEEEE